MRCSPAEGVGFGVEWLELLLEIGPSANSPGLMKANTVNLGCRT